MKGLMIECYVYFQVDQLFSCLCHQFKLNDISTLEVLMERIVDAPITPKPICRSLDFIYDWKLFINDKLSNPPLKYTSKYHSFLITADVEEGKRNVKFFGKKYPQDTQLVPRSGIRILKEGIKFEPIGTAEYRIEKINFDEILRGIHVYLSKQTRPERLAIMSSWDRLRDKLEGLPRRSNGFPKLKLDEFPSQQIENLHAPDYLLNEDEGDGDGCELTGDKYPENVDEGDLDSEIREGIDVCIFTEVKNGRPWVGRVVRVLDFRRFIIHWYTRKTSRSKIFTASFEADGSRSVTELENDSVMFWSMSENRTKNSFSLSPFWLENINREYDKLEDLGL